MNIGLIGSGGREHAIADALLQNPQRDRLIVYGNSENVGIQRIASVYHKGSLTDNDAIIAFFQENQADYVVIGPELPLINGAADALRAVNIPALGPNRFQAQLEGSKTFMRNLMQAQVGWGSLRWQKVTGIEEAREFISEVGQAVIKPIGLTGGKGVQVMGEHLNSIDEALSLVEQILRVDGEVLLEERLIGEEFSRIALISDGTIIPMPIAQDFKYAYEGDKGGMTGGMGSYTMANGSMPFLQESDLQQADKLMAEVVAALEKLSGNPYRGFLYGQFMATRSGVTIIEFNVRLGDPEAINVMSLFKCDVAELFHQAAKGALNPEGAQFEKQATLCKYLVPVGYPEKTQKDLTFQFDESLVQHAGFKVRFASVEKCDPVFNTLGSRTLAIIGKGPTPGEISEKLEKLLERIEPPVLRHRKDIGTETTLIQKTEHMLQLRSNNHHA